MTRRVILTALTILVIGIGCLYVGFTWGQSVYEPKVLTFTEYVTQIKEVPIEVIKGVPIVVTKDVIVEKPIQSKEFASFEEAQTWVNVNKLPIVLIADNSGNINLINSKPDSRYDCDDYARDFQNLALKMGWQITQIPINANGQIWGVQVMSPSPIPHVANWTRIGNSYYYIESSPSTNSWKLIWVGDAD